ncbi:sigma factor G inhibitor Gin [Alkalicoccobacillus porphyridii]|uniref:Sigma factor G inhibitor Gin n=1 Tax=Alkalicoccobacillus porphyridii TaxID=2597270 RepID=A0A553ZUD4_9BACI|nr:sigma factor G inhibitor Gin [Alkalicoccobacillus porphyridii]TSB45091.1 hypothetical protein FN960_18395 [Alkalicoccobacillus porphyridii]
MKRTGSIRIQLGQSCLICETRKTAGYKLVNSFVCGDCERKIVGTETGTEDYLVFVSKMRGILKASN